MKSLADEVIKWVPTSKGMNDVTIYKVKKKKNFLLCF